MSEIINYQSYCNIVKAVWGEEFQRLEEYIFAIVNEEYDLREDKPWVEMADQGIPSFDEFIKIMRIYGDSLSNYDLDSDEYYTQVDIIKNIYYDNF